MLLFSLSFSDFGAGEVIRAMPKENILFGSLWLSEFAYSLQSPCLAHKALVQLVAALLRYMTFYRSGGQGIQFGHVVQQHGLKVSCAALSSKILKWQSVSKSVSVREACLCQNG